MVVCTSLEGFVWYLITREEKPVELEDFLLSRILIRPVWQTIGHITLFTAFAVIHQGQPIVFFFFATPCRHFLSPAPKCCGPRLQPHGVGDVVGVVEGLREEEGVAVLKWP